MTAQAATPAPSPMALAPDQYARLLALHTAHRATLVADAHRPCRECNGTGLVMWPDPQVMCAVTCPVCDGSETATP